VVACLIIAALINRTYYELIGCIPFYCLYGRDPWLSTLVAPGYWATAEPPLEVTDTSKAEEEDLNGNEEVLSPPPDENGDRRQAAEQEREDDKYSNKEPNGS
jgi:hypothetical protein